MARSRYDIACGREPPPPGPLKGPGVVVNAPYPQPIGALYHQPFQYGLDSTAAQTIDLMAAIDDRFLHRHTESERFLETGQPPKPALVHSHVVVDESDWVDAQRICRQIMERPLEQPDTVGTLFVGGAGSGKTRSLLNSAMTYLISRPNSTAIVVTETDRFNYSGPGRMIFVDWDDLAPYLPSSGSVNGQGHKVYLDNLGLCPFNIWDSIMSMASRRLVTLDASINNLPIVVREGITSVMFHGLVWRPFYLSQPGFDIAIRR